MRTALPFEVLNIIERACDAQGVGILDVLGNGRTACVVRARHAAMRDCYADTRWTIVTIASFFGRHHSTILYAAGVLKRRPKGGDYWGDRRRAARV